MDTTCTMEVSVVLPWTARLKNGRSNTKNAYPCSAPVILQAPSSDQILQKHVWPNLNICTMSSAYTWSDMCWPTLYMYVTACARLYQPTEEHTVQELHERNTLPHWHVEFSSRGFTTHVHTSNWYSSQTGKSTLEWAHDRTDDMKLPICLSRPVQGCIIIMD